MSQQPESTPSTADDEKIVRPEEFRAEAQAEPPEPIAAFEAAIKRRTASFAYVAEAAFYGQAKFNHKAWFRYKPYLTRLTEAFENAHGNIVEQFFCANIRAAAVLTDRHELCVIHPAFTPDNIEIAKVLFECDRLNVESDRVLRGSQNGKLLPQKIFSSANKHAKFSRIFIVSQRERDLQTTKKLIYAVVSKLLGLLDRKREAKNSLIDLCRYEASLARDYYLRAAVRCAKLDYLAGMLLCAIIAVGALSAMFLVFNSGTVANKLSLCLAAGGVGAVVSVMSRMTFGQFALDFELGRLILMILGAFRPLIGMVFGAAMWILSASGVLAIGPSEPNQVAFFHILIAFLGGFSERWAQDMLGRAAGKIGGHEGTADKNTKSANIQITERKGGSHERKVQAISPSRADNCINEAGIVSGNDPATGSWECFALLEQADRIQ